MAEEECAIETTGAVMEGSFIDQSRLLVSSLWGLVVELAHVEVVSWEEFWGGLKDATKLSWLSVTSWGHVLFMVLQPCVGILQVLGRHIWPHLQRAGAEAWMWQRSQSWVVIGVEVGVLVVAGLLLALHRLIAKRQVVQRCKAWVGAKKEAVGSSYASAIKEVEHKSRLAANLLPHVMYWSLAALLLWSLPAQMAQLSESGAWTAVTLAFPILRTTYIGMLAEDQALKGHPGTSSTTSGALTHHDLDNAMMYWVIFSFLQILHYILGRVPGGLYFINRIFGTYPKAAALFFFLWLQLPGTAGGISIAYTGVTQLVDKHIATVTAFSPNGAAATASADVKEKSNMLLQALVMVRVLTKAQVEVIEANIKDSWMLCVVPLFLFTPGFITYAGCIYVGMGVPALNTIKIVATPTYLQEQIKEKKSSKRGTAIDNGANSKQRIRWVMYWAVYGLYWLLHLELMSVLRYVPLSSHIQLAFLLWLQLPYFRGAIRTSQWLQGRVQIYLLPPPEPS